MLKSYLARLIRRSACFDALVPLGDLFRRPAPHMCADPVQEFRIGSPVKHPLLERRGVEFEEVEKIAIEADGQIVIVLNLAGMTEQNHIYDSPNDERCQPAGLWSSSDTACSWCGPFESLLHFV